MSLEKIANNQSLSKQDIITAAEEYVELEKQAADADNYGREAAREYVEKIAAEADEKGREAARKDAAEAMENDSQADEEEDISDEEAEMILKAIAEEKESKKEDKKESQEKKSSDREAILKLASALKAKEEDSDLDQAINYIQSKLNA